LFSLFILLFRVVPNVYVSLIFWGDCLSQRIMKQGVIPTK
jgi:hypothetical protein